MKGQENKRDTHFYLGKTLTREKNNNLSLEKLFISIRDTSMIFQVKIN